MAPSHTRPKSKPKSKQPSLHSRSSRRATSPSINTDKSLKNIKPPLLPGSNVVESKSTGAGTGAGVSKRSRKQRKSREQRIRLEKAVLRAENVLEKMGRKVEGSRRKEKSVRERSGAWEEINGKIDRGVARRRNAAGGVLELGGNAGTVDENGEWEDAGDSEEEQVIERVGKMHVDDGSGSGSAAFVRPALAQEDIEDDEVL